MKVLNVGGGASRCLPPEYDGWEQDLLDIDPAVNPDICCDALELVNEDLHAGKYEAVYCSHNLEHFYAHQVLTVLFGFKAALKEGGFVDISVPNVKGLMQAMLQGNLDINDVWYRTGQGQPITFHDVLYGWSQAMSQGNLYYAHKCGFTAISLHKALSDAGFKNIVITETQSNLTAKGYV